EDGIRDFHVTGVQTCALPICRTLVVQFTAVALMFGYALLLVPVGFLIATTVLAAALAAMLGARPLPAVASGALVSAGVYLLFTRSEERRVGQEGSIGVRQLG